MNRKQLLQKVQSSPIKIVPGRRVISVNPGEWTSPFEGKGFETMRFRDFQLGDDPRTVHLATTVRRGEPTVVERIALRDLTVMVVLDLSPSMLVRDKFDIEMMVAVLLLFSAWKAETTFGLAVHDGEFVRSYGSSIGTRHFYRLYNVMWQLISSGGKDRSGIGRRTHLSRSFPRNSIIFYCSDFLGESGDLVDVVRLWRQMIRYDLIPVVIQDEFEHTFPMLFSGSFVPLNNPETGSQVEIWLSKEDAKEIREINESRYQRLVDLFANNGTNTIHTNASDVDQIRKQFIRFFEQRKRRGAR